MNMGDANKSVDVSVYLDQKVTYSPTVAFKTTTHPTIGQIGEWIKKGKWRGNVETLRAMPDNESRKELKRQSPAFTPSVFIADGKRKSISRHEHTGLICFDIDLHDAARVEPIKELFAGDPATVMAFRSIIDGVKVIQAVNTPRDTTPEQHKSIMARIAENVKTAHGVEIDPQTFDIVRCCFISFDPDLYLAKTVVPINVGEMIQGGEAISTTPAITQEPAENYEAVFQKMLTRECKGLDLSDGNWNSGVYFLGARANDYQIPLEKAKALIWEYADRDDTGHEQAMATIESAYKNESQLKRYEEKQTFTPALFANIINRAESWNFRLNLLTNKIEKGEGQEMTEIDLNTFYIECSSNKKVTRDKVWQALNSQYLPSYHPFKEYLQYLETIPESEYSGTLDDFLGCFQLDEQYHANPKAFKEQLLKKWLGGIIGSMAGNYSITALILVGGQKTYKSTVLRELLPEPLRRYFAPARPKAHPDFYHIACSNILACDDEYTGYSKLESETFKQIISSEYFEYRAPYARTVEKRKRTAVLCGTSNSAFSISDVTGNRRLIVCNVKSIDYSWMQGIDRNMLFAELYALFRQNPTWWYLTDQDIKLLADENELNTSNPVLELVERLTEALTENEKGGMTSTDVMEHVLAQYPNQKGLNSIAVGQCLTRLYGPPKTTRFGAKSVKAYRCKQLYKYNECGNVVGDAVRTFEKLPHPETRTT